MTALVFKALKRSLRAKGITYAELAQRLGVSEPTIKRIFQDQDCKLGRLYEICAAIGVEFESIVATISDRPTPGSTLPPEIEWKLAETPSLVWILVLLSQRFTPEGILRASGISRASLLLHFRDLERLGLVTLGSGLNVRLTLELPINWNFNGPLRSMFHNVNTAFTQWVMERIGDGDGAAYFNSFSRRMRQETALRLEAEAEEFLERVRTLAWHDQHTSPENELFGYKWSLAVGRAPFGDIMDISPHPRENSAAMTLT